MTSSFRVALALAILGAIVPIDSPAEGQQSRLAAVRKLEDKWEAVAGDWDDAKGRINAEVIKRFDAKIADSAKLPGLTDGARADRKKLLQAAKKQFAESKTFPSDDKFDEFAYFFAKNMSEAFLKFDRSATGVLRDASKLNGVVLVDTITKEREKVAEALAAIGRPGNDSRWQGTHEGAGGKFQPYQVDFSQVEAGGSFKGHVEENLGVDNNWSYDIEGQSFGAKFEYSLTKTTRGTLIATHVIGYFCGDRLFGEVVQATTPGQTLRARIILRKTK